MVNERSTLVDIENEYNVGFIWNYEHIENSLKDVWLIELRRLNERGRKPSINEILDNVWNSTDWETFKKRYALNVAVYWPGQPEPTRGRDAHHKEAVEFFKTSPDNHVESIHVRILSVRESGPVQWQNSQER